MKKSKQVFRGFKKQLISLLTVLCLILTLLQPAVEVQAGTDTEIDATVSVSSEQGTVEGYVGEYITPTVITITLTETDLVFAQNVYFDIINESGNQINDLNIKAKRKDDKTVELTLYGIAKDTRTGDMRISIDPTSFTPYQVSGVLTSGTVRFDIVEAPDSCVGTKRFYSNKNCSDDGWNWNSASRTLTLSGVNITGDNSVITTKFFPEPYGPANSKIYKRGIYIGGDDDVTVVLEGANAINIQDTTLEEQLLSNVKYCNPDSPGLLGYFSYSSICGLASKGNMTIKGSGTLDIKLADNNPADNKPDSERLFNPIRVDSGSLTIESGIITCSGYNSVSVYQDVTITGGYLDVKTFGGHAINFTCPDYDSNGTYIGSKYTQTGGYVKAVAMGPDDYGLFTKRFNMSGGYLVSALFEGGL